MIDKTEALRLSVPVAGEPVRLTDAETNAVSGGAPMGLPTGAILLAQKVWAVLLK